MYFINCPYVYKGFRLVLYWIIKNNFDVDHSFQLLCKGIKPINNVNTVYIDINKSNKIRYFIIFIRAKFDSVTYIESEMLLSQGEVLPTPGRSVTNSRANCYQSRANRDCGGEGEV